MRLPRRLCALAAALALAGALALLVLPGRRAKKDTAQERLPEGKVSVDCGCSGGQGCRLYCWPMV